MVRLGTSSEHSRERVPRGPEIPRANSRTLVELDDDDLSLRSKANLVAPVEVEVAEVAACRCASGRVREILGGDQVGERGGAHVGDVDPAEQAVPIAVVRLAPVEVVERRIALDARRHGLDLRGGPEHLLVEVVDLAVLDLEVPPERASQPADLGGFLGARALQRFRELPALVGGQRPLAHFRIRAGREVDAADGAVARQPVARPDGRQPLGVVLEGGEEALNPAALAPAVLPGRGPGAELLPVVAHRPEAVARLRGVLPEVLDDLVDLMERDQVSETLLRPEDRQQAALVVRGVRAPNRVLGDRGGTEVGIVEDRPGIARGRQ